MLLPQARGLVATIDSNRIHQQYHVDFRGVANMTVRVMRWVKGLALGGAALLLMGAAKAPKIGQPAPDFELTLVDGSKVHLADLKGQVVVLNFWATWCVPCRKELPELDAYYTAQRDHGLRVFTVTTEDSLPLYQLKRLFSVMKMSAARKIKGPFEALGGVPTNYIIDRAGVVRYARSGALDKEALDQNLLPLLREPAPVATAATGTR